MSAEPKGPGSFRVEPIGVVHSPFRERKDAPRQAPVAAEVIGKVELFPGRGFEDALSDLALWDYVWLVVWFHHNHDWRPKVQPPRSSQKRGVFATRSPHRPNPIGMSAVKLVSVVGLELTVQGLDLLDGTPVLDLKPYVPYSDAIPGAGHGWLDEASGMVTPTGERPRDPLPGFEVQASAGAGEQLAYLEGQGVLLWPRIREALALGPTPHAYRRIRKDASGDGYTLSLKDWRVRFRVAGREIVVERIASGYKPRELLHDAPDVHRAFALMFP